MSGHSFVDGRTGLLLLNLGTPDQPQTPEVRRYLRQFLSDPRVIDIPAWKRQLVLNLFILPSRPKESAEAYREVWTDEGSPLLVISRQQQAGLAERLGVPVALGMRYGNPSIRSALEELRGCDRIVVLPAYPQYSATTTASTFDAVGLPLTSEKTSTARPDARASPRTVSTMAESRRPSSVTSRTSRMARSRASPGSSAMAPSPKTMRVG